MTQYNATKEEIIELIRQFHVNTGAVPSYRITAAVLGVSPTVVRVVFGTWSNAIKESGLLPIRERVGVVSLICHQCGHQYNRRHSATKSAVNYCSRSCAAAANNSGRTHTEATKQKIAKSVALVERAIRSKRQYDLICQECGNPFVSVNKRRKTCSSLCKNTYTGKKISIWLTTNRAHIKGSHVPSYMESSFKQWLVANGLNEGLSGFLTEIHFYNDSTKKNGWADFVFPRRRCIIELDGSQHQKRIPLDSVRDEYLRNRGWTVVRITHKEYRDKSRIQEIKQLLALTEYANNQK